MPYGILKVDTITFTDNSVDKTISLSGLIQNPTFTGNVTATGTISGAIITAPTGVFTTLSGTTTFTNCTLATTGVVGVVQLTDSISSTSITTAATPNSVKSAYDLAAAGLTTGKAIAMAMIFGG